MLWGGFPFLTAGEGLSKSAASLVLSTFVVFGMLVGPIMGMLSSRHPLRRSRLLVLPTIALQAIAWLTVVSWPGQAPAVAALRTRARPRDGRTRLDDRVRPCPSPQPPSHRLSTATGIVNGGGFIAGLIAIFLIGVAMDVQGGAGTPVTYSLDAFRIAFLTQLPLWALGTLMIVIERHRTRVRIGLDAPWGKRREPSGPPESNES